MSISLPALSFLTATQINFVGIELVSGFPMSYLAEISRSGESSLKLGQTMFGADEDVLPNDVDWFVLEIPISVRLLPIGGRYSIYNSDYLQKPSCPAFTVKQRLTRMTRGSLAIQIALAFESAYDVWFCFTSVLTF